MRAVGSAEENVSWLSATVHHQCITGTEKWTIETELLAADIYIKKKKTSPILL